MKKIFISLSILSSFAAISAMAVSGVALTQSEIGSLKGKVESFLKVKDINIPKAQKIGKVTQFEIDLYTPRGREKIESFLVDGVDDIIFAGSAYNKSGSKLAFPLNAELIKNGVGVKIGHGAKQVYLVIDPECPYCQQLEQKIPPSAYDKFTINVIPFPLSFHKDALPMFYWIFDKDDPKEIAKRIKKVMVEGDRTFATFTPSAESKARTDKIIKNGYAATNELQAQGTPTLYNNEFQQVSPSILFQ